MGGLELPSAARDGYMTIAKRQTYLVLQHANILLNFRLLANCHRKTTRDIFLVPSPPPRQHPQAAASKITLVPESGVQANALRQNESQGIAECMCLGMDFETPSHSETPRSNHRQQVRMMSIQHQSHNTNASNARLFGGVFFTEFAFCWTLL